ncbi:MAG TPA: guanylate kinase, partial [Firmicutes bacterium]|nr:guanylate kinase [Bacillota bacterium]
MKSGLVYVVSAPSGAGKTTIIKEFLKKHRRDFEVSVSVTTRKPRKGEKNGRDYIFYDKKEFLKEVKKAGFLEYAKVLDNYYGTLKSTVEKTLKKGKNVIMDVDVQGAKQLKKKLKNDCVTIFILPPSFAELSKRLKNRKTEDKKSIAGRIALGRKEWKERKKYDYTIIND